MLKQIILLSIFLIVGIISPAQKLENKTVEAACGQCQFAMKDKKGCDLAIRVNGKAYFVKGTSIDQHGDAHAKDGFCNAIRKATVTGEVKENYFQSKAFKLIQDIATNFEGKLTYNSYWKEFKNTKEAKKMYETESQYILKEKSCVYYKSTDTSNKFTYNLTTNKQCWKNDDIVNCTNYYRNYVLVESSTIDVNDTVTILGKKCSAIILKNQYVNSTKSVKLYFDNNELSSVKDTKGVSFNLRIDFLLYFNKIPYLIVECKESIYECHELVKSEAMKVEDSAFILK